MLVFGNFLQFKFPDFSYDIYRRRCLVIHYIAMESVLAGTV